jgi:hypothetical protein
MRLVRHLSFSNVIAMLALFIALGGAAYAGTKINGSSIKNGSIGGGKLKNETITGNKLKKGTLTGAQIADQSITGTQIQNGSISATQINLSTLPAVPLAQDAQTATKADSAAKATSATSATTATTATNAKHAETADSATKADSATSADSATHADSATSADTATSATTAGRATSAEDAERLGGKTPAEISAELELTCPSGTEFYGGMCWDQTTRPINFWIVAVKQCGEAGGRLPSIEELVAFVLQPGTQVTGQTWSADLDTLEGGEEAVFTTSEGTRATAKGIELGYRCVFPQSN